MIFTGEPNTSGAGSEVASWPAVAALMLLPDWTELCTMLPAAAGGGAGLLMLRLLPVDLLLALAGLLALPIVKPSGLSVPKIAAESMARKALMALLVPVLPDAAATCTLPAAVPSTASAASQASRLRLAFLTELEMSGSISSAGCLVPASECPAACAMRAAADVAAAGLTSVLSALVSGDESGSMALAAKGDALLVSETTLPSATSSASSLRLMALMVIFCSLTAPGFTMLPDTEPERPTGGGVTMFSSSGEGGGTAVDCGEAGAGLAASAGEPGAAVVPALRCGLASGPGDELPGPAGFLSLLAGVSFLELAAGDGLGCVAGEDRTLVAAASGVLVLLPSLALAKAAAAVLVTSGDVVVLPKRVPAASAGLVLLLPSLALGGVWGLGLLTGAGLVLLGLLPAVAGGLLLLGLLLAGVLVAALDAGDAGATDTLLRALLLAALPACAGEAMPAASSGPVLADSAPARFFSVLRLRRRC
jgi:hypothetical protein